MDKDQVFFAYKNEQLDRLVITLSTDRLGPYLAHAGNDRLYAIKLYEWNTALSESFYGVLQGLEVSLRNSFHRALAKGFGKEEWYDISGVLQSDQREAIKKAKGRIIQDGKSICPGKVVAELTFGFWVALTGPAYAQSLWDKHLNKAFIARLGRKGAHRRLERIRKLRNRVAHHESIIGREVKEDYSLIIEAVHWICPVTAEWMRANSSFHTTYRNKPQPPLAAAMAKAEPAPTS